ncbi:MAG: CBS domain-containing protein [Anaerolineae bacterium]|nr:MAG: CBS domain-containing protein [Anaerolineae bacterium]
METVRHLLQSKSPEIWSVAPDATVFEALQLMAEKDVGALLVMDGDRLVGIFSERDYARKVILRDRSSRQTLVREIMTSQVICVSPEQTIDECMALMTARHIRHLPVVDSNQRVCGVISIGDVVKAVISDQALLISHLHSYILGDRGEYLGS